MFYLTSKEVRLKKEKRKRNFRKQFIFVRSALKFIKFQFGNHDTMCQSLNGTNECDNCCLIEINGYAQNSLFKHLRQPEDSLGKLE